MDEEDYEHLPIDPETDEWNERVDDILAGSPFDEDLGRRMARDAIAVSLGEMSDRAFHEKYHEAVKREFGQDDRPTGMEGSTDE